MPKNTFSKSFEILIAGFVGGIAGYIVNGQIISPEFIVFSIQFAILLGITTFLVIIIPKILKLDSSKKIKIKNNKSWFNRNRKNIQILANVITIASFLGIITAILSLNSSYDLFNKQLEVQKQLEFDDHLSNIRSLELELAKDFNLTHDLNNKIKTDDGKKQAYFGKLITENLQRSVIDGKISNEYGKKHLIYTLFYDIELNNVLESVSSSNVNISLRMKIYEQLSRDIEDKYINILYNTYGWICEYRTCLEGRNKSIEYCNRYNETKQTIYCLQPKISYE